jgi:hypothetical protein
MTYGSVLYDLYHMLIVKFLVFETKPKMTPQMFYRMKIFGSSFIYFAYLYDITYEQVEDLLDRWIYDYMVFQNIDNHGEPLGLMLAVFEDRFVSDESSGHVVASTKYAMGVLEYKEYLNVLIFVLRRFCDCVTMVNNKLIGNVGNLTVTGLETDGFSRDNLSAFLVSDYDTRVKYCHIE